jgi:hypothetical protein
MAELDMPTVGMYVAVVTQCELVSHAAYFGIKDCPSRSPPTAAVGVVIGGIGVSFLVVVSL